MISRLTTRLQHTLSTLHERRYRRPCKTRFRLTGSVFTVRDSNPPDHYERFPWLHHILLSRAYPDASWSHVRRPFKEAADALGKVSRRAGAALQALSFIAKLYRAESELSKYRATDPDRFVAERRARVEPVLEQLHLWLLHKHAQVLPGSALGKAVAFALSQWPKLIRYLEHAQLTPDNNACEQAIRPFVVGRKNWLFSGSPRGAAASATLYSLIETAKANGREPYWYLRELFEQLPHARTQADYLALLPTARPAPPPS